VSSDGILMAAYGKGWRQHVAERVNLTQRYMQLGLMHRLSFTHGVAWARSQCRFALSRIPLYHMYSLTYSVPLFLKRQGARTPGGLPDPGLAAGPVDWEGFDSRWGGYVGGGLGWPGAGQSF
jgi:hypothetical protein